MAVSQTFPVSDDHDSFEEWSVRYFVGWPMIGLGLWVTRGRPERQAAIFITSYQGCVVLTRFITVDVDRDHLVEGVSVRFLCCKITLLLSILHALE